MTSTINGTSNLARDLARHEGTPYYLSLCTECDDDLFPQPEGEGYVDVAELRDGIAFAEPDPNVRMVKMALGQFPQPEITITLAGEEIPVEDVMELQAGEDGWLVLYRPAERCLRCNHDDDHIKLPVVYGQVAVRFTRKAGA